MRIVAGILLIVAGMIFPMGLMAWLNGRLNRAPLPSPRQVGLILALNGLLPVGLVLWGLGLLSARLWGLFWLRGVLAAVWAGAALVVAALMILAVHGRKHDGR